MAKQSELCVERKPPLPIRRRLSLLGMLRLKCEIPLPIHKRRFSGRTGVRLFHLRLAGKRTAPLVSFRAEFQLFFCLRVSTRTETFRTSWKTPLAFVRLPKIAATTNWIWRQRTYSRPASKLRAFERSDYSVLRHTPGWRLTS